MKEYTVKFDRQRRYKVTVNSGGIQVPARFRDLLDYDESNKNDQYVIMYNAATDKYQLVNPDKVLSSSAVTETIQPGLPEDFENVLDTDLDNRIDLDAGTW